MATKIISVCGANGSGKTTMAVNLATALTQTGSVVGLIQTELAYPSIQGFLGMRMVYMLYQYSCDEEESYNILTPIDLQFDDVSQISQWALDGVRYAYTNGLISGMDDDTFRPQQTATRAQAASIISRLLDKTE